MSDKGVTFHNVGDSALKAEIEIKAAPEKVYDAWTKQDAFLKWFGPRSGGHLHVQQFDCAVGGRYDATMVFADGDQVQLVGTYQTLIPPEKIVFTWQWKDSPTLSNDTLVTIDLVPTDTGTRLTLTHERFLTVEARDQHQEGWGPLLSHLSSILAHPSEG